MESVHKMHNIKDERETVSALCHLFNCSKRANTSLSGFPKPFSHGVTSEHHCMYTEIYHTLLGRFWLLKWASCSTCLGQTQHWRVTCSTEFTPIGCHSWKWQWCRAICIKLNRS